MRCGGCWPRTPSCPCRRGQSGGAAATRSSPSPRPASTRARPLASSRTRANGQPALAYYALDAETGRYGAAAIDVLGFDGTEVTDITAFVTPGIFATFGLPPELPSDPTH